MDLISKTETARPPEEVPHFIDSNKRLAEPRVDGGARAWATLIGG